MQFRWDVEKERANRFKHGIGFDVARELFAGARDYLEIYDEEHSQLEDRFIAVGPVRSGTIVVVFTEPEDGVVRNVSARSATRREIARFLRYLEGEE